MFFFLFSYFHIHNVLEIRGIERATCGAPQPARSTAGERDAGAKRVWPQARGHAPQVWLEVIGWPREGQENYSQGNVVVTAAAMLLLCLPLLPLGQIVRPLISCCSNLYKYDHQTAVRNVGNPKISIERPVRNVGKPRIPFERPVRNVGNPKK